MSKIQTKKLKSAQIITCNEISIILNSVGQIEGQGIQQMAIKKLGSNLFNALIAHRGF